MSRILFCLCVVMLSVQALAQDQLPGLAPNDVQLNELPLADTLPTVAQDQPIMTSFPMAVPPAIQFGNQCPHECNPCNTNLWDGYCAEKRLWCHKCQPHCGLGCGLGCGGPLCKHRCRQPICTPPACAPPVCEPPCASEVPCARLEPTPAGATSTASDSETTLADLETETKTASKPRPSGSPLRFWNPDNDSFSLER